MSPPLPSQEAKPRAVCHIYTPVGMLGYGLDEREMHQILSELVGGDEQIPTAIIVDSGSTDSGPKKLAQGDMTCPPSAYERDLSRLLRAVDRFKVPLLIGSAGGAGLNQHVEILTEIVEKISSNEGYSFSLVQIFSEIDKQLVTSRLAAGSVTGCSSSVPDLTQSDIDECRSIVAQMGHEPYIQALRANKDLDVIIGGRAYDPAPYFAFATVALKKLHAQSATDGSFPGTQVQGGFMHAAKILECGGICASPKSAGAMATLYEDGSFDIRPTTPTSYCTPLSVAAHTLYEKSRPDILHGPGGYLDVTKSTYEALEDGRTVRVQGSRFYSSAYQKVAYQVKLEAARNRGFRSIYMGSHKDPILISQLDDLFVLIKQYVRSQIDALANVDWDLDWHVYGRDDRTTSSGEVFVVGESRAPTQELARSIVAVARAASIHGSYPGQKATSGNFAFGIGGVMEIDVGLCSEFCVYHLMQLEAGEEVSLFPAKLVQIKNAPKPFGSLQKGELISDTSKVKAERSGHQTDGSKPTSPPAVGRGEIITLGDAAKVLRSKNSGPYEITFDVMFELPETYQAVKAADILTRESIAQLFNLKPNEVVWSGFFDPARSFKATIPRKRGNLNTASGGYLENDVHGSQMYLPLMQLRLPASLRSELNRFQRIEAST